MCGVGGGVASGVYVRTEWHRQRNAEAHPKRLPEHGTQARYAHGACRCDACRTANSRAQREQRAKRRARGHRMPSEDTRRFRSASLEPYTLELPQRFWDKVAVRENGCWEWTARTGKHGYGQFYWNDGAWMAHRAAYAALVGPLIPGLTIDHLCHNADAGCRAGRSCPHRRCVNPAHLEQVTIHENSLRGNGATATHCVNGHLFDEANTYIHVYKGSARRHCRACQRDRDRRRRALKKRAG